MARSDPAMAYDPKRKRIVLFGGEALPVAGQREYLADTWEWDGEYWIQVSDMGPRPQGAYAMAWDEAGQRLILFGGADPEPDAVGRETWGWDGESWTQLEDQGPRARYFFAMAGDTRRKRVVLFGGASGSPTRPPFVALGDTWEWDGTSWTQREEIGPPARNGHAMAFDATRNRTVLTGGTPVTGSAPADTWEWDGIRWVQVADTGAGGRIGTAMAFDGAAVILFGGQDWLTPSRPLLGDTWSWDGRFWVERQDIGPSSRRSHRLAFDAARGRVVLFGGQTTSALSGDTWELAPGPPA